MRPAVSVLAWIAIGCAAAPPPLSASIASLGHPAGFSAPDDRGALVRVPAAGARATVVELWSADCEACRSSLPALAEEGRRLGREGIAWVPVGVLDAGEPVDRAGSALRSWGVDGSFLVDRGGGVLRSLGIDGLPATVVIDREGVVRWVAPPGAGPRVVAAAARWVAATPRRRAASSAAGRP